MAKLCWAFATASAVIVLVETPGWLAGRAGSADAVSEFGMWVAIWVLAAHAFGRTDDAK